MSLKYEPASELLQWVGCNVVVDGAQEGVGHAAPLIRALSLFLSLPLSHDDNLDDEADDSGR